MRTLDELLRRLAPYGGFDYLYDPALGYIAWHYSTGENLEILFIEAAEKGRGHGAELYRRMCRRIVETRCLPYHSVFGFHLTSNEAARRFYDKLGWIQVDLGPSVYRDGGTTIMWIPWKELLHRLGLGPDGRPTEDAADAAGEGGEGEGQEGSP